MDDEVAALVVDNGSGMCKVSSDRPSFGNISVALPANLKDVRITADEHFPGWFRRRRCSSSRLPFYCGQTKTSGTELIALVLLKSLNVRFYAQKKLVNSINDFYLL